MCARAKSNNICTALTYMYIINIGWSQACVRLIFGILSLSRMQINCRLADKQCNSLLLATTVATTGKLFISFCPHLLAELWVRLSSITGGDDRALQSINCFDSVFALFKFAVAVADDAFIPAFYGKFTVCLHTHAHSISFAAITVQSDAKNKDVIAIKTGCNDFRPKWCIYCFFVRFNYRWLFARIKWYEIVSGFLVVGIFEAVWINNVSSHCIVAYTWFCTTFYWRSFDLCLSLSLSLSKFQFEQKLFSSNFRHCQVGFKSFSLSLWVRVFILVLFYFP